MPKYQLARRDKPCFNSCFEVGLNLTADSKKKIFSNRQTDRHSHTSYIYIYIYIYMCVCVCTYIHTHTHTHTHIYIYIYIYMKCEYILNKVSLNNISASKKHAYATIWPNKYVSFYLNIWSLIKILCPSRMSPY